MDLQTRMLKLTEELDAQVEKQSAAHNVEVSIGIRYASDRIKAELVNAVLESVPADVPVGLPADDV